MTNTQFRAYLEARLTYSQTQVPAEKTGSLEKLAFGDLKTLLNKIDTKAENIIPNYWQTMLDWHQKKGTESLGEKRHATGVIGPTCWAQVIPEEKAKQTILMIERYLANRAALK